MSILKFTTQRLVDDEHEDMIWEEWREINTGGVIQHTDDEVRNLHSRFSLLSSEAEINFAKFDGSVDVKKLQRELKEAALLNDVYNNGPMNARMAQTKADERYLEVTQKIEEYTMERALWKGRLAAIDKAVTALSRELSYRMKT